MSRTVIIRTQTGVRIESSLLKVLKGLAEYTDLTLGDLLEGEKEIDVAGWRMNCVYVGGV